MHVKIIDKTKNTIGRSLLSRFKIASISIGVGVDGHRSDITMMHTARAHAAFHGRSQIVDDDIKVAARLTLKHRMRRLPFEEQGHDEDRIDTAVSAVIEG